MSDKTNLHKQIAIIEAKLAEAKDDVQYTRSAPADAVKAVIPMLEDQLMLLHAIVDAI